MCDPGSLAVVSDQTQSEKPEPGCQHAAEEIQVSVSSSSSSSSPSDDHYYWFIDTIGSRSNDIDVWWEALKVSLCVCVCVRARRKQQQQQREAEQWEEELKYQVMETS